MVRLIQILFLAGTAVLLVSCGNEGDETASTTAPPQNGFKQKSGELFDDDSDKMINRYAKKNPMMQKGGDKPAEEGLNRDNQFFEGEFAKREFASKDYSKKSFWGSKDYAKKVYGGDTNGSRFQKGSRFSSKGAKEGGLVSDASGSRFGTNRHATGAARESGRANISRTSDAKTDSKRKSYKQPKITDWRDQRGLTIDDTRRMLGRNN